MLAFLALLGHNRPVMALPVAELASTSLHRLRLLLAIILSKLGDFF